MTASKSGLSFFNNILIISSSLHKKRHFFKLKLISIRYSKKVSSLSIDLITSETFLSKISLEI